MSEATLYEIGEREAEKHGFGWQRQMKYGELFAKAMCGEGDFWPAPGKEIPAHDSEQYLQIYKAVHIALRSHLSDAERWKLVMRSVQEAAHQYADFESDR